MTHTRKIARTALALLAAVTIALCATVLLRPATVDAATTQSIRKAPMSVPKWMTRPCAQEDSVNCYWDARTRGTGHGRSFYARLMPHTHGKVVCIFYVKRSDARVSDQCYHR